METDAAAVASTRDLSIRTHSSIDTIAPAQWNRLAGTDCPFLRHEFLAALEHQGGVGEKYGWVPQHLTLQDRQGKLVAAAPCYLKFNSYGEFVFDWSWADAFHRAGIPYYPKLVIASPYTPATGSRILTEDTPLRALYAEHLINGALRLTEEGGISSLHWLFTTEPETQWLEQLGLLRRLGCQFHWHNRGYRSFEDLLSRFSAHKRKNVNRERRRVRESGIHLRLLTGAEVSTAQWAIFHQLYCSTFRRRGGIPTLSLGFFQEIAATMGENLLLVLAYLGRQIVAAAFNLRGTETLYGRHWGCNEAFHSLHFETCYYQGLEYCIAQGLSRFEPGAQGEYKVSRGFLPTATWSAHWIADPRFRSAIGRFLELERIDMQDYLQEMRRHSPYKQTFDDSADQDARA
ncbi:MAG: GNAT family N-acetyltransferase [Gammaproteobacteria bacterium]